jgi:hypothetical protein
MHIFVKLLWNNIILKLYVEKMLLELKYKNLLIFLLKWKYIV